MSSSSATGISSRSPSPTTPEASDDLHLVAVQDEDYPWLTSSPVPRPTSWDNNKTLPYSTAPHNIPSLCLQDLIHDSTIEDSVSPVDSVSQHHSMAAGLPDSSVFPLGFNMQELFMASQQHARENMATLEAAHIPQPPTPQHPVVCPPKIICQNLPIVMPSIPAAGTKSRVETQIRLVFDLASAEPAPGLPYNRVGSWRWLRLPKGTATKRRARKGTKITTDPADVLSLSVDVTCASPPFTPVLSCQTCQAREAKRLARKIAARVRPPRSDSDNGMDEDGKFSKGEDTTSIIQFNCQDMLEFSSGSTILPLRITCYCRHHREKVGFRVTFTLRDDAGRVVGTGTTPPIMITDDHKTGSGTRKKAADPTSPTTTSKRKDGAALTRIRAKPYDTSRPTSRKVSAAASPSSSHQSLPETRPSSPGESARPAWIPPNVDSGWGTSHVTSGPSEMDAIMTSDIMGAMTYPVEPNLELMGSVPVEPHTETAIVPQATLASPLGHMAPPLAFFPAGGSTSFLTLPTPVIHRIVPAKGPTCGGTEVTVLGSNFQSDANIKCVFGDVVATSTQRWSDNTLVCIVPPRLTPGAVPVWIEGHSVAAENVPIPHFTYEDESDRALMELALQVLGLKLTGKVEDAKNVALRIVGNTSITDNSTSVDASSMMQVMSSGNAQFEATVMKVLALLKVSVPGAPKRSISDVISLQTSGGQSLLHLAVIQGLIAAVSFLLELGIDVDLRDKNGYTALHFAALTRSLPCARLLIGTSADMEVVDACGRTAREVAPVDFFRSIRPSLSHTTSTQLKEEEAEMGDNEDESDHEQPKVQVRRRRNTRHRLSTSLHLRPAPPESDQDTVVPPSPEPPRTEDIKADPVTEKIDEKPTFTAYAELLQRTITQLSKETLSSMPQMIVPFLPPIPQLPGMPNVPWTQLPQIPVFPILVPTPAWPAFLDKRTPSSESVTDPDGTPRPASRTSVAAAMKVAQEWLANLEKLRTLTPTTEIEDSPPPVYTPRVQEVDPSLEKPVDTGLSNASARGTEPATCSENATPAPETRMSATYEYRPAKPQVDKLVRKQDRMLFFFWLPMLFAGCLWAAVTAMAVALQGARTMVEIKTGIRL